MDRTEELFGSIFGNKDVKAMFDASIKDGSASHCYIIEGPRGSGKHTLSYAFIKALSGREFDSKIDSGNELDIIRVGREEGKKSIGIRQIRELKEKSLLPPTELEYLFFLIEDADSMTAEAQNALLKLLEEPPAYIKLLLLCESLNSILPTVLSRAAPVKMELFEPDVIADYLTASDRKASELRDTNREKFDYAINTSGGSIGIALEKIHSRAKLGECYDSALALIEKLAKRDKRGFNTFCISLPQKRESMDEILGYLEEILRDFSLVKAFLGKKCDVKTVFFPSVEKCNEFAKSFSIRAVQGMIHYVVLTHENIDYKNANVRLAQVMLADKLWQYASL